MYGVYRKDYCMSIKLRPQYIEYWLSEFNLAWIPYYSGVYIKKFCGQLQPFFLFILWR